jgi:hypothetical protein
MHETGGKIYELQKNESVASFEIKRSKLLEISKYQAKYG